MQKIFQLVFLITILSIQLVFPQNFSHVFGEVTIDEMELAEYEKDKAADAIVIYKIGKLRFSKTPQYTFDVIFEESKKIKILKETGNRLAEIQLVFYKGGDITERIIDIEVCIYNLENGNIRNVRSGSTGGRA